MKERKIFAMLLATLLLLGTASTGCAKNPQPGQTTPGAGANQNKVVTIDFWHFWGSEQRKPTITAMIDEFNKNNPNIQVKGTYVPWGDIWTKSLAAVAAGNPPDVVVQDILSVGVRAARKQNTDITSYIKDETKNKYLPNLLAAVTLKISFMDCPLIQIPV
jgi:multiple sugar transport system substrate-binding protein